MSYKCQICFWEGFSNHLWLRHLTAAEHQLAVKESLGAGELDLLHPDNRHKVVLAKGINNNTPLLTIAEHLSQWGELINFIHRTTQVNASVSSRATIEVAVIYENVDSVVDAVKEENQWIWGKKADIKRMVESKLGIDAISQLRSISRAAENTDVESDTDNHSDSDSDQVAEESPEMIRAPTPDSGWELDTEEESDSNSKQDHSSDYRGIRQGRIRVNRQLWKFFETAIGGLENCEEIYEMDVRLKFQTLWQQFIVEFTKKFFSQCCLLTVESKSLSDEEDVMNKKLLEGIQEAAKNINMKNLSLRERFEALALESDISRVEYRCLTGKEIAGWLYGKKFWKKKYQQAVTLPMWAIISGIRNSKQKELIEPHNLIKPKALSILKEMEFVAKLEINFDNRENNDIPANGNIGAFVNLKLEDESYGYKGRNWRLRKLRLIVSLFEILCSKYLNLRIKKWISSCKGMEEFDKSFKKEKKQAKGHPKWRKFRLKRINDLKEKEKYRKNPCPQQPTKDKTIQHKERVSAAEATTSEKKISKEPTVGSSTVDIPLKIKKKKQKKSENRKKFQQVFKDLLLEGEIQSLLEEMVQRITAAEEEQVEVGDYDNHMEQKRKRKKLKKRKRKRDHEEHEESVLIPDNLFREAVAENTPVVNIQKEEIIQIMDEILTEVEIIEINTVNQDKNPQENPENENIIENVVHNLNKCIGEELSVDTPAVAVGLEDNENQDQKNPLKKLLTPLPLYEEEQNNQNQDNIGNMEVVAIAEIVNGVHSKSISSFEVTIELKKDTHQLANQT